MHLAVRVEKAVTLPALFSMADITAAYYFCMGITNKISMQMTAKNAIKTCISYISILRKKA
jgi:hypothetical protein